jgi:hypothetical protein
MHSTDHYRNTRSSRYVMLFTFVFHVQSSPVSIIDCSDSSCTSPTLTQHLFLSSSISLSRLRSSRIDRQVEGKSDPAPRLHTYLNGPAPIHIKSFQIMLQPLSICIMYNSLHINFMSLQSHELHHRYPSLYSAVLLIIICALVLLCTHVPHWFVVVMTQVWLLQPLCSSCDTQQRGRCLFK